MASAHPGYTPGQLRTALDQDAIPIACPADYDLTGDGTQDAYCAGYEAYNGFYGHGMVDALAAAKMLAPEKFGAAPTPAPPRRHPKG